MRAEDMVSAVVRFLHDARDLVIDAASGFLGVVLRVAHVATKEHLVVGLAEHLRAQLGGHAVLRDHGAGHLGGALQVVAGAGGHIVAEDLLGDAAAHEHRQLVAHLAHRVEDLVLLGDGQGVAQRAAAADDADLVHRIGLRQQVAHQGMTAFVVRDGVLGLVVHHAALALGTGDDALHGLADLLLRDDLLVAARGQKRGLVKQVGQVGAGKAGGELGHGGQVHVAAERLVLRMHVQDALAALHVGHVHHDLTVEATGAQQRGVEHVGAVRGGDEHHGVVGFEAIHLDEQLVERLLALVVAAAQAGAALAADGVDLVDEDDGGACFLRLLEQVAHAGGAHAHEHLDEVGAGDAEERHAGLAGHGAGQQRLAGARRAHQQAAARDLRAHGLVLGGVGQEVLDLLHLLDGLVHAGDVGEAHVGALLDALLGLGLAEVHLRVIRLRHLVEQEEQHGADEDDGQQRGEDVAPRAGGFHLVLDLGVLGHQVGQRAAGPGARELVLLAERLGLDVLRAHARERLARVRVLQRCHAGVHGVDGAVERIGGGIAGRDGRVIRAGHGIVAGAVRDLRDAILVDGLQELGRHQLIGGALRRLRHAHELLAHEEGHQQEKDNRDDGCPGVGLLDLGFVVLRHRPCFPSCRARASGRRCTAGCGSARRSPGRSPR